MPSLARGEVATGTGRMKTGKHLNFLATNVKYMILKIVFIHLQSAKRLNSFLYKKNEKKIWLNMYTSQAKNTRNAHYGVFSP